VKREREDQGPRVCDWQPNSNATFRVVLTFPDQQPDEVPETIPFLKEASAREYFRQQSKRVGKDLVACDFLKPGEIHAHQDHGRTDKAHEAE
jgi:hypothetical protein